MTQVQHVNLPYLVSDMIKILLAEDEIVLAKILSENLVSQGYEVKLCKNGQEAFESFNSFKPDVCIFDVMMPLMDGITLAREIRKINQITPILFLTAKSTSEDVVEGFDAGGNDYLRKPFSMLELSARIKNLLRSYKHVEEKEALGSSDAVCIGQFKYDARNQELLSNSDQSTLSYREHELLMKLLSSKKAVVPRSEILKDIWGDDSFF